MGIKNKVSIVTGGAKRVGRAICKALAERGSNVAVHFNQSEDEAQKTVDELKAAYSVEAICLQADLSRADDIDRMIKQAKEVFKRIDILVNNAAVFFKTPFLELRENDWDTMLDTNLKGPFLCAKAVVGEMIKQGQGKIINIADIGGIRPWADYIPYCVSKAGLIALTQGLAKTLAPTIQVNCIAPGEVLFPEDYVEEVETSAQKIVLKKLGSPEDIARTVVFLIEGSDFITGSTFVVDGGRLIS